MNRDRFDEKTKRALQDRAGNRCSNPNCMCLTSGPNADPEKATRIGVAAHITAASPGGARYDPSLSPQERKSAQNGIWLCETCDCFVDKDEKRYPPSLLRSWKAKAEKAAFDETQRGRRPIPRPSEPREEGWDCPYCGAIVGFTKLVCRGCNAEVVHGITESEFEMARSWGILVGIGILLFIFVLVPEWLSALFVWEIDLFYGLGFRVSAIASGTIVGISVVATVITSKIVQAEKVRFIRR